jgi:small subunit ribosomal protein S17e
MTDKEEKWMGKSRSLKTKRIVTQLLDRLPDQFSSDFEENKKTVEEVTTISSKSIRNKIAGRITKLIAEEETTKNTASIQMS